MRATNAKCQAKQSLLGAFFLLPILELGMLPLKATIPLRQDSGRGWNPRYLLLLVMSITNLFSRPVGCLGTRGQADTCPASIALALYTAVYALFRMV